MNGGNYPNADDKFLNAPYFNFNDDKVKFNTNQIDNANDNYGSASASLPKSLLNKTGILIYQLLVEEYLTVILSLI